MLFASLSFRPQFHDVTLELLNLWSKRLSSPYRKENTALHRYTDQTVNVIKSVITSALYGRYAEMLIAKSGGTCSYHWTLKG
jgi:hypothetical protein